MSKEDGTTLSDYRYDIVNRTKKLLQDLRERALDTFHYDGYDIMAGAVPEMIEVQKLVKKMPKDAQALCVSAGTTLIPVVIPIERSRYAYQAGDTFSGMKVEIDGYRPLINDTRVPMVGVGLVVRASIPVWGYGFCGTYNNMIQDDNVFPARQVVVYPEHPMYPQLHKWAVNCYDMMERLDWYECATSTVVNTCRTVGQLKRMWPDITPLLPPAGRQALLVAKSAKIPTMFKIEDDAPLPDRLRVACIQASEAITLPAIAPRNEEVAAKYRTTDKYEQIKIDVRTVLDNPYLPKE